MTEKFFHTQENRGVNITEPIICNKDNAWLGTAYYFWLDEYDAIMWGKKSKRATGKFQIYIAEINTENILDTVFEKQHYLFWVTQIEKFSKKFAKTNNIKPTLKEINDYFLEHDIWSDISGIMFQDISRDEAKYLVKDFQYKKRIQLAVYDKKIINTFAHHYDGDCL